MMISDIMKEYKTKINKDVEQFNKSVRKFFSVLTGEVIVDDDDEYKRPIVHYTPIKTCFTTRLLVNGEYGYNFTGLNDIQLGNRDKYKCKQISIPFEVKKIISGGAYSFQYNVLWTVDDRIFILATKGIEEIIDNKLLKPVVDTERGFKAVEFKYKDAIKQSSKNNSCDIKIKQIIGNSTRLLFWMENGLLYNFTFSKGEKCWSQITTETDSNIVKALGTGIMSSRFMFTDEHNYCYIGNNVKISSVDTSMMNNDYPVLFACSYGNNDYTITSNNLFYVTATSLSGRSPFKYIPTCFENESKVIDMKCGYAHVVMLLENNEIYTFGISPNRTGFFQEVILKADIELHSTVLSIHCLATSTIILTESELINWENSSKEDPKSAKRTLTKLTGVDDKYFDDVAVGPWYFIAYKRKAMFDGSSSMSYYFKNLKQQAATTESNNFCDIIVYIQ